MFFPLVFASLAVAVLAAPATVERRVEPITILSPGSIQAPADGTELTAGDSFPLGIAVPEYSHCAPLYTTVEIYILADKPTTSSLNSTYQFSDYLYYFGSWVTTNIPGAFPPPNGALPPPASLTTPDMGSSYNGQELYLATIEVIGGCPPDGYTEYAIDSASIIYIE
ncbi:hypothetical protein PHLGIDRAFT_130097 [Phlebiopsis gigantea 11061_1 CR5-6]|uniref:Uncharacterized protein n=1 Tax=Phlebiopsis gigantea (strain 11061_1 CR5-6) TaxID=745531 RepID=A0A0C3NFL7_PHLG1|nr:hypothetical protein PHLGIDRAFT_130097 [Phlebiopsis gigantea 11061_1 CR5-6]